GEDIDWCWRIKQAKWKVFYTPDSVIYHVHGASSRLRPVGATINLHKGMEVFYKKHLAPKYWAPFNMMVYAAIWSRAAVFILINIVKGLSNRQVKNQMHDSINKNGNANKSESDEKAQIEKLTSR